DEVPVLQEVDVNVGDPVVADVARRAAVAVLVDEQVAGDSERDEVERGPRDDLVDLERDRPDGVDRREAHPRDGGGEEPEEPRLVAGPRVGPDRAPDPEV